MFNFYAQNPGDSLIDNLNKFIPNIVNNAQNLFNYAIVLLTLALVFLWIYMGIVIYRDAKKRFEFDHEIYYLILLLIGVISGPVGLIVYNIIKPKQSKDELDFIKVEHKFYYHQASKVVDCLYCSAYVLEGESYCTNCGTQNRFKCSKCGTLTDYDDNFCHNCGFNFGNRGQEIMKRVEDKKERENGKKNKKNRHNADSTKLTNPRFKEILENAKRKVNQITESSKVALKKTADKAAALRREKSK